MYYLNKIKILSGLKTDMIGNFPRNGHDKKSYQRLLLTKNISLPSVLRFEAENIFQSGLEAESVYQSKRHGILGRTL